MRRLLTRCNTVNALTWSVPAGPRCPAFTRSEVCGSCYARKGRYRTGNVRRSLRDRARWWNTVNDDTKIEILVRELQRTRKYVRLFKSGDLRHQRDAMIWYRVAYRSPHIDFWVSTRSWVDPEVRKLLAWMHALPNVCVRRSALSLDLRAPRDRDLPCTSMVSRFAAGCPKQTAGSCAKAGCRACWDKAVRNVTYRLH